MWSLLICSVKNSTNRCPAFGGGANNGADSRARWLRFHVHVDRVPENDDVYHEAERAKLVLLAFAIALAQLAAFAMEHDARELMPSLAAVELDQDAPTVMPRHR